MNKRLFLILSAFLLLFSLIEKGWTIETYRPETSVAGFIQLSGSGRQVYNFNPGWRFFKGDIRGAESVDFDDCSWTIVSTPHTVELMPAEASGCRNYQGPAWYRKHFVLPAETKGKQVLLHFEAAMGKQILYLNGKRIQEHIGGYLPFTLDLTANGVQAGDSCLLAVFVDNSNDKSFPPGKPQYTLDFAYHGGIYRDVWMIAKSPVSITDAIESQTIAGGGVFVHFDKISEKSAQVYVNTELQNKDQHSETVTVETALTDTDGKVIRRASGKLFLKPGEKKTIRQQIEIKNPKLWSPDSPYLYRVQSRVKKGNQSIDGGITRIGIRQAEFRGKDGFWLNGKPFGQLVGANRHQDFAYVGNALPNSQQWRDAKRLRDAGCTIIRVAHYPQDPAFMDACDELGMFVIVATPGWQYWNKDVKFGELVHQNTREMIRRDRNHPSVLMWEPILNETRYPLDFALKALEITKEEFPYPGRPVAAADVHSAGVKEHYDVVYGWPGDDEKTDRPEQCIFTREFGENVDDWYAHNNNNRASRSWGERPLLVQALSLAKSYDEMYRTTGQFIGGAQWHPFDHQRGYHPDPYWGGIYDAFRQKKYAYEMFRSQSPANLHHPLTECGPMVFIAHEMSQFSDKDVVIFSNCDSVRLSIYDGTKSWTKPVIHAKGHIGFKKNVNVSYKKLEVRVSAETLNGISVAGSGDIFLKNGLQTDDNLTINVAGSGDIKGSGIKCNDMKVSVAGSGDINANNITCNNLKVSVAGSGDMILKNVTAAGTEASVAGSGSATITGTTQTASYSVAGSGDLLTEGYEAQRVSASVAGSGSIKCFATEFLKVRTSGSGKVGYKGNPELDYPKKSLYKL